MEAEMFYSGFPTHVAKELAPVQIRLTYPGGDEHVLADPGKLSEHCSQNLVHGNLDLLEIRVLRLAGVKGDVVFLKIDIRLQDPDFYRL